MACTRTPLPPTGVMTLPHPDRRQHSLQETTLSSSGNWMPTILVTVRCMSHTMSRRRVSKRVRSQHAQRGSRLQTFQVVSTWRCCQVSMASRLRSATAGHSRYLPGCHPLRMPCCVGNGIASNKSSTSNFSSRASTCESLVPTRHMHQLSPRYTPPSQSRVRPITCHQT